MLHLLLLVFLVAADQYTKYLALTNLSIIGTIPIIDGIFSLTYVENRGAAFGILQGQRLFFVISTCAILTFMFMYYKKLPKQKPYSYLRFSLALTAAGALGNFIDRAFRGFVVDFLHVVFIDFPVFNLADCYVCIGAFMIAILIIFVVKD